MTSRGRNALPCKAVEGRVPLDCLAHIGDGADDEGIEATSDVALPTWHGRDVSLHGSVALSLRNLGVAASEGRFPFISKRRGRVREGVATPLSTCRNC
jgi:hypothetical protein